MEARETKWNGKQRYSVCRGEWYDPGQEIAVFRTVEWALRMAQLESDEEECYTCVAVLPSEKVCARFGRGQRYVGQPTTPKP